MIFYVDSSINNKGKYVPCTNLETRQAGEIGSKHYGSSAPLESIRKFPDRVLRLRSCDMGEDTHGTRLCDVHMMNRQTSSATTLSTCGSEYLGSILFCASAIVS